MSSIEIALVACCRQCGARKTERGTRLTPRSLISSRLVWDESPYSSFQQAAYSPAGLGFAGSYFATWIFFARPIFESSQMPQKFGSSSYHLRPCRAETGCAWWLLCQPSPPVSSATHQLLRESSRVSKRRLPHRCVAEFTSQVACRPSVTRSRTPHRTMATPFSQPPQIQP